MEWRIAFRTKHFFSECKILSVFAYKSPDNVTVCMNKKATLNVTFRVAFFVYNPLLA